MLQFFKVAIILLISLADRAAFKPHKKPSYVPPTPPTTRCRLRAAGGIPEEPRGSRSLLVARRTTKRFRPRYPHLEEPRRQQQHEGTGMSTKPIRRDWEGYNGRKTTGGLAITSCRRTTGGRTGCMTAGCPRSSTSSPSRGRLSRTTVEVTSRATLNCSTESLHCKHTEREMFTRAYVFVCM